MAPTRDARTWLIFLVVALVTVAAGHWPDSEWRTLDLPVRTLVLSAEVSAPLVILVQALFLRRREVLVALAALALWQPAAAGALAYALLVR